mmetsp:Transcript_34593/g.55274  ORF Transcript_34593/g.55274 Transcript_34593/m.55274 type:complete len:147 (+) Transcript_34593:7482-7922(+)
MKGGSRSPIHSTHNKISIVHVSNELVYLVNEQGVINTLVIGLQPTIHPPFQNLASRSLVGTCRNLAKPRANHSILDERLVPQAYSSAKLANPSRSSSPSRVQPVNLLRSSRGCTLQRALQCQAGQFQELCRRSKSQLANGTMAGDA